MYLYNLEVSINVVNTIYKCPNILTPFHVNMGVVLLFVQLLLFAYIFA